MDAKSSLRQRKHFIPLESNPEVFNELIYKLGVPESLEFQDVLSLDDPDLLAFLPRPAYALVLVFPTTDAYQKRHDEEDSRLESYKENQADNGILFFRQTINNACGLYGILHSVCNGDVKSQIVPNSTLDKIKQRASSLNIEDSAMALEDDEALEQAYAQVARKGDTQAPDNPEDWVDYHYVCFVKSHANSHLYQLDGDRKQPIDLGVMAAEDDVLSDKCLSVVRGMFASEEANPNFSLMALVSSGF